MGIGGVFSIKISYSMYSLLACSLSPQEWGYHRYHVVSQNVFQKKSTLRASCWILWEIVSSSTVNTLTTPPFALSLMVANTWWLFSRRIPIGISASGSRLLSVDVYVTSTRSVASDILKSVPEAIEEVVFGHVEYAALGLYHQPDLPWYPLKLSTIGMSRERCFAPSFS